MARDGPQILSMEGLSPISSSWSASSSTSTLRFWHLDGSPDVSKWSMRRPGVAIRKSHRCEFILERSDLMFVPPNTTCDLSWWNLSSLSDSSWICDASSRVGGEDEHGDVALSGRRRSQQRLDGRDEERDGLAGSRLGAREDVEALEDGRQGLILHRGGVGVPEHVVDRAHGGLGQAEGGEGDRGRAVGLLHAHDVVAGGLRGVLRVGRVEGLAAVRLLLPAPAAARSATAPAAAGTSWRRPLAAPAAAAAATSAAALSGRWNVAHDCLVARPCVATDLIGCVSATAEKKAPWLAGSLRWRVDDRSRARVFGRLVSLGPKNWSDNQSDEPDESSRDSLALFRAADEASRHLAIAARPFTGDRHGRHGRRRSLRVRPARRYRRCGRAKPTERSPRSRPRCALPDTSKPSRCVVVVVVVVFVFRVLRRPASSRVRRASRMEGRAHDHARDAPDPRRIVLAGLRLRREWSHHARGGDG